MAKQRKRDGVYWRKDRRMYWISFVDVRGLRQRKPGAQSWDEARQVLAETLARVKEEVSLRPGEVLACRDSFADVARRFLAYQKPRLTLKAYQREEGIAAQPQRIFHRTAGGFHVFPSVGLRDRTAREGGQVERAEGIEHPQTPLPAGVRGVEATAAFCESVP